MAYSTTQRYGDGNLASYRNVDLLSSKIRQACRCEQPSFFLACLAKSTKSGAQSFFSVASLRTLIPGMASAYIFLSSAFYFSRAFSRLASVSLMRPYFLRHRWRVAMDICFCLQNASWFRSLLSASRNKRMISSGLCLFCFMVSRFVCSKLLTRFGPVFQAATITFGRI